MEGSKWDREVPTIQDMMRNGKTNAEIAEYYNQDPEYMRVVLKRLRRKGVLQPREVLLNMEPIKTPLENQQTMELDFTDSKEVEFDWRKFLQKAIELQDLKKDKDISQQEATIRITTNKPFAVSFTSDWHVGNDGTDYRALLKHIDLFTSVQRLYVGLLGDYRDVFSKFEHKSGMYEALFGPQDQSDVAKAIFTELGSKILFKEGGNHDEFNFDETGIDVLKYLLEGSGKAPYLREGGAVNLIVNDQITYRIYAKHKYRYYSSLNVTNSPKRMHDLTSPFDVGVVGHTHQPSIEIGSRWSGSAEKDVIYIVTGTYKTDDRWARGEGFGGQAAIGCPTVIFFPNQKKMLPFRYVEDAVMVLESLDASWDDKGFKSKFI